jgi:hypothetical protein
MLDERPLQRRNKTHLDAYRILGLLVMFAALYFYSTFTALLQHFYSAATSGKWWVPKSEYEINVVFWSTMLIAATLPTALTAWFEPDRITED